jgi:hypothetical protein
VPLRSRSVCDDATLLEAMRRRTLRGRKRSGRKLRARKPVDKAYHHSVYVILLSDEVLKHRWASRLNPNRNVAKPAVYVGMTGIPVDHRFENHRNGYKSARVVQKYGVKLLPELFEHLNPMPFEAAAQMEKDLTEDLRAEGYTVLGGT